jgi:hypothetical protein
MKSRQLLPPEFEDLRRQFAAWRKTRKQKPDGEEAHTSHEARGDLPQV